MRRCFYSKEIIKDKSKVLLLFGHDGEPAMIIKPEHLKDIEKKVKRPVKWDWLTNHSYLYDKS